MAFTRKQIENIPRCDDKKQGFNILDAEPKRQHTLPLCVLNFDRIEGVKLSELMNPNAEDANIM